MKNNCTLRIKPWVLFKVAFLPVGQTKKKIGLLLLNLQDGTHLALRSTAAGLWLTIDGVS